MKKRTTKFERDRFENEEKIFYTIDVYKRATSWDTILKVQFSMHTQ